ncbi:hypothetical protein ACFC0K_38300 [Streptomyces hydrogenans]|uniref:hypothetical protein n=1 Tax=Streptomyces hydrogenans TaxID=1873719 RepID=UPI0035E065F7
MAHERLLPELAEGDLVVLHDTGAYYSSAPWAYNSIPRPGGHGFLHRDGAVEPATVRTPQTLAEVVEESGLSHGTALLRGLTPGPA